MNVVTSSVEVDPEVLSGEPVFAGTRVPLQTMMDYLKAGERVDDFLADFPTVTRAQVASVLDLFGDVVLLHARSA